MSVNETSDNKKESSLPYKESLQAADAAFDAGRYAACEEALREAVKEAESTTLSKSEQAEIFLKYGQVLQKLSFASQAELYLNKAKDIYEHEPGKQSHEYSETVKELGELTLEVLRLDESQRYFEEALAIRRAIYPSPSDEIAVVLTCLGDCCWRSGDMAAAMPLLDEAAKMQLETTGEWHWHYADTLENKALVLLKLGKFDESLALIKKSFEIREKVLPEDHPYIAYSLSNLATVRQRQGLEEGNEPLLKRALEIAIKTYGEESSRTATLVSNIGGFYAQNGNLLESERYFARALAIKERTLGEESEGLITALNSLGVIYSLTKRPAEAAAVRSRVEKLMKTKLESHNKKDVDTMIQLADKLMAQHRDDECLALLLETLQVAVTEYGADSLKVAQVVIFVGLINMNSANRSQGAFAATSLDYAKDCYAVALRIKKKHLGNKHPELIDLLAHLSTCFLVQGANATSEVVKMQADAIRFSTGWQDPAITAMEKVLNIGRDTKGANDPRAISALRTLAHMHAQRGNLEKAADYEDQYLNAREELLGSDSAEFAQELITKASTMLPMFAAFRLRPKDKNTDEHDEDEVNKSIKLLEKVVVIGERLGGEKGNEILVSALDKLASAFGMIKRYEDGERCARRAVDVVEKERGEHHLLAVPLSVLAGVLYDQDKTEEAEAVEARKKALPQASAEEQREAMKKIRERTSGMLSRMLAGLSGFRELAGGDTLAEPDASTGNKSSDAIKEVLKDDEKSADEKV